MDSLSKLNKEDGVTIVISLHQVQFALQYCPRSVALKDGRIIYDGPSHHLNPEKLQAIYGTEDLAGIDGTSPLSEVADETQGKAKKKNPGKPEFVPVGLAHHGV